MIKTLRLEGLDCANCAAKLERKVSKVAGIKSAVVNFMTGKLTIELEDENNLEVLDQVQQAIYKTDKNISIKKA